MARGDSYLEPNAESGIAAILDLCGDNPRREGLVKTPHRVVKAFKEMTAGYELDPAEILSTVFEEGSCDEMVALVGVEFWSLCEHHLLPFHGTATMAYIPNGKVVGLSKLARLLHCYARRFQIQEKLTSEIANAIQQHLAPRGVGVILKATHLCMAARGVQTPGTMVTSALLGEMRDDPAVRGEFLCLHGK